MNQTLCRQLVFLLALWVFALHSLAEPLTSEMATLKGAGVHVNRLAFSADGSRLAAAMCGFVERDGKDGAVPGRAIVWNIEKAAQLCVCNDAKADFTHIWMSADGKTVVTAKDGTTNLNIVYHEWIAQIVTGENGYQAWDATRGAAFGSSIAPRQRGSYSAAAVSADGRYLAAVFNDIAPGPMSPLTAYVVGEIRVWDLAAGRIKWRLAGQSHKGPINWSDALAFSPDGTRLAVYRSMGDAFSPPQLPGPPQPVAEPFKSTRVLKLEPGSSTPTETILEKRGIALPARLEWPGDGATLILRDGRSFDTFDPATGHGKEVFKLPFPSSLVDPNTPPPLPPRNPAPRPPVGGNGIPIANRPAPVRLTDPGADPLEVPLGFSEPQSALSADGSILAVYIQYLRQATSVMENRVALWDMHSRRLMAMIRVPDEPYSRRDTLRHATINNPGGSRPNALAISGDGRRIAVSDGEGTIHVYDTARIVVAGSAPAGSGGGTKDLPPTGGSPQVSAAAKSYDDALQQASTRLLESFDKEISELERSAATTGDKTSEAAVSVLKQEKLRFEQNGRIPWSRPMWGAVGEYLNSMASASKALHTAIVETDMPLDLRERVDRQVVARWKHQPGNRILPFYSNGQFGSLTKKNYWTFDHGELVLHWEDARAAGGVFVTRCTLAPDGRSYRGTNQLNRPVSGTYLDQDK